MSHADGIREFLDRFGSVMPPDFHRLPIERQRVLYRGVAAELAGAAPDGVTFVDAHIEHGGRLVPVRIYRPAQRSGDGMLVYLRGGFALGSLDTHHGLAADLCARTGLVAVAPDFRTAPEHCFPAAIEDCYDAVCGLTARPGILEIDPRKIVLCGDSSGASHAVAVAMMARDRRGPRLRAQALLTPLLDFTRLRSGAIEAPPLSGAVLAYYTAWYAPRPEQVSDPYVSPLVSGQFDHLPTAYVMAAALDPLLADSHAYARHLRANGATVELVIEPGLTHSPALARRLSRPAADAWQRYCAAAARLAGS
jgi:acetyl esterase